VAPIAPIAPAEAPPREQMERSANSDALVSAPESQKLTPSPVKTDTDVNSGAESAAQSETLATSASSNNEADPKSPKRVDRRSRAAVSEVKKGDQEKGDMAKGGSRRGIRLKKDVSDNFDI
jgi:hypothetical protein